MNVKTQLITIFGLCVSRNTKYGMYFEHASFILIPSTYLLSQMLIQRFFTHDVDINEFQVS